MDNSTGGNVCVVGLSDDPQGDTTSTAYATGIPARLACNIEIMKDDENASNGEGRGFQAAITYTTGAASATNMPPANYRNCDNYTTGLNVKYAFRVF
jgi:hypothetical protein